MPRNQGARGRSPVLVLGLDGATFDLMLPWAEQGDLPCLAELLRGGVRAPLLSTIPPITPPAWASFLTGRNPGKHRIFDFAEPRPGSYDLRYVSGSQRSAPSLWGLLGREGRTSTVINVPMTYPPEEIPGRIIAGLDAPDETCAFTWPRDLIQEIRREVGDYRIDIRHLGNMRGDAARDETLRAFAEIERVRAETTLYLMRSAAADLTMVVFNATDQVQHHFWHHMDPSHPHHDPAGAARYRDAIRDVYRQIDGHIGRILDSFPPDAPVLVVSDHGAGPVGAAGIHLNQALAEAGLLSFRRERRSALVHGAARAADRILRTTLSSRAKSALARAFPALRVRLESLASSPIDWERTQVFAYDSYVNSPHLYVNSRDRFPAGTVEPGKQAREVAERAREVFQSIRHPETGQPLVPRVYHREEAFWGPWTPLGPDLIPAWWEPGAFVGLPSDASRVGKAPAVVARTGPIRPGLDFTACHRREGVLVMARGPFRRGAALPAANLWDIAPTVLHLLGCAIPSGMDGKVLASACDEGYLRENPVRIVEEGEGVGTEMAAYSAEEEEMIKERLQGIGYLE